MNRYFAICITSAILTLGALSGSFADTATLLPNAVQQFFDNTGKPASAGTLQHFVPNTSTPKTVWKDANEATPWTNTITLDTSGRPTTSIYGSGTYRQLVKDRNGVVIWDAVTAATGSGGVTPVVTVGDGNFVGTVLPWSGLVAPANYLFAYGQPISRITYAQLLSGITSAQSVICTSGINVLSGISDTQNIHVGTPVEASCVPPGTTVTVVAANSVTVSAAASVSTVVTATFFPYGNGDRSTTFNLPDYRGQVLAGRNNMGGIAAAGTLGIPYFSATVSPNGLYARGGTQSHTLTISELPASPPASGATSNNLNVAAILFGAVDGGTSDPNTFRFGNNTGAGPTTKNITPTGTITVTGNLGGGFAHSIVQPTTTANYVIKVLPDASTAVASGVASINGMTGVLLCGTGMTCSSQTISAVPPVDLRPFLFPASYGATCDGVTNDAVALQAWLTDLSVTGKTGYVPPGAACITGTTLVGLSNTTILGGGRDVSSIKGIGTAFPVLSFTNTSNIDVSNLAIVGSDSVVSWTSSSVGAVSVIQNGAAGSAGSNYSFRNVKFYGFNNNYWFNVDTSASTLAISKFRLENLTFLSASADIPTDGTASNNSNYAMVMFSGSAGNGQIQDVAVKNSAIDGPGLCYGVMLFGNVNRYQIQNNAFLNFNTITPGHCVNGDGTTNNAYPIAVYDLRADGNPATNGLVQGNSIINPYSTGIYFAGDGGAGRKALVYNNANAEISGNLVTGGTYNGDFTLPRAAIALNNVTNVSVLGNKLYNNYGGIAAVAQTTGTVTIKGNDCDTNVASGAGNRTSCLRLQPAGYTDNNMVYTVEGNTFNVQSGATSQVVRTLSDSGYYYGSIVFNDNKLSIDDIGASFAGIYLNKRLLLSNNSFSGVAATSMLNVSNVHTGWVVARENTFDLNAGPLGTGFITDGSLVYLYNNVFLNRSIGTAYAFSGIGTTGTLSGTQFNNITTANQVAPTSIGLAIPVWSGASQDIVQNLAVASNSDPLGWINVANGIHWTASTAGSAWQVANHAVPVGKGSGVGFNAAVPSTVQGCLSSTGASSDPSFGSTTFSQCGPVSYVSTMAGLRALTGGVTPNVRMGGYYVLNDGADGWFIWDPASVLADNGGTVIQPDALPASGRWLRQINSGKEYNVIWFGAKGDNTTNDYAAVNNAITVAIAAKGGVYFPSNAGVGAYRINTCLVVPDNTHGLRLYGDNIGASLSGGNGSFIFSTDTCVINMTGVSLGGTGSISNIDVSDLILANPSGAGPALKMWNVSNIDMARVTIDGGINGLDIAGTAEFNFKDVQFFSGSGSPILASQAAVGAQNIGPGRMENIHVAQTNGSAPVISITGDPLGVTIANMDINWVNSSAVAAIELNGVGTTPVGSLTFEQSHGESVYNSTNTGKYFRVGNTNKFGTLIIHGGNFWCHGNGVNYLQDAVQVVDATNIIIDGSTASNLGGTGCSRSMIRTEATFTGKYSFRNNVAAVSGTMYSDANGKCSGTSSCLGGGQIIDTLALNSPLAATSGGTGFASFAVGDLIYADTTTSLAKLAAAAANNVLLSGTTPTWGKVANAALANSATTVNGQTCTLGSTCTVTASATNVTVGTTTITTGTTLGVLYNNAGVFGNTAAGTNGQLFLGVTSGAPVFASMSNDATITNAGALTIANAAVSYAKIANLGALAVMGRSANSSGVGADIQATAASDAVLRESGSVIGFGTIATGGIANNAVTLAKLATQATNTVLGNASSGSAVPTALSMTTCSTAASAVIWTTNTGFGCNTSITAAAMPTTGLTGTLQAAQEPAHTGDVTNSAGSLTTVLANIPTGVPAAGSILYTNISAPSSPASGKVSGYADSTDLRFHDKNASGVIGTTVVADTGASNNFLTAISAAGAISKAQPSFSNLSGSVAAGQMPALTGACTTSAGAVATTCTINTTINGSGATNNIAAGATGWVGIGLICSSTESFCNLPQPQVGTVSNFYLGTNAAAGAGQTYTVTMRKNASNQTVTCTISGASATTCNDTTHSFTVAAADNITIQITSSGAAANISVANFGFKLATTSP